MASSRRKKAKVEVVKPKKEAANDEILKKFVDNVDDWYKYFNDHIERARNFLTFLYVDQWDLQVRQAREAARRPVMQFNKLTPIIRSILGEQRENSPALTVRGIGKDVKQDAVDLREGLLRQIHYDSDADIVYQIASKHALECGWGAARVCTKYENEDSFNQVPYIEPIVDFQCAFFDSTAQRPDKSDGDHAGVYTTMSKSHFERTNPGVKNPESIQPSGSYNYLSWNTADTITICEMYYKEYFTKEIVELSDGNILSKEDAKEVLDKQEQYLLENPDASLLGFEPLEIVNEREAKDYKMKYVKFIQNQILEQKDYPGKLLPIVYFEGDSTVIDGERIPLPYIQDGIDSQKLINYIGSETAYMALRARKETVMGTVDNFAGHEQEWLNPDQVQGALTYNFDKKAGKPDFISPQPFNPAYLQLYESVSQDLQANLGWYDEAKGNETNATSGLAISRRQQASKKPVNVYNDNWARGIKQIGKVLLDLFPHLYDTERTVMTRGEDGSSKAVEINKRQGFRMHPDGEIEENVMNDMTSGKYDIEVRVDGSYDAQTAQAMDVLIRLASINPAIGNLIPDLLAENSGLENSQQLVARLKTLLPPEILAQEEGKPMPPPAPPQPDPALMVQMQKNQLGIAQNNTREKQLLIDEQKVMLEAKLAGIDKEISLTKANAEVTKAMIGKDVAMLAHATKTAELHAKSNHSRVNQ